MEDWQFDPEDEGEWLVRTRTRPAMLWGMPLKGALFLMLPFVLVIFTKNQLWPLFLEPFCLALVYFAAYKDLYFFEILSADLNIPSCKNRLLLGYSRYAPF
jgi:type IV secretory pathway VirB3-like protein